MVSLSSAMSMLEARIITLFLSPSQASVSLLCPEGARIVFPKLLPLWFLSNPYITYTNAKCPSLKQLLFKVQLILSNNTPEVKDLMPLVYCFLIYNKISWELSYKPCIQVIPRSIPWEANEPCLGDSTTSKLPFSSCSVSLCPVPLACACACACACVCVWLDPCHLQPCGLVLHAGCWAGTEAAAWWETRVQQAGKEEEAGLWEPEYGFPLGGSQRGLEGLGQKTGEHEEVVSRKGAESHRWPLPRQSHIKPKPCFPCVRLGKAAGQYVGAAASSGTTSTLHIQRRSPLSSILCCP